QRRQLARRRDGDPDLVQVGAAVAEQGKLGALPFRQRFHDRGNLGFASPQEAAQNSLQRDFSQSRGGRRHSFLLEKSRTMSGKAAFPHESIYLSRTRLTNCGDSGQESSAPLGCGRAAATARSLRQTARHAAYFLCILGESLCAATCPGAGSSTL